jgi:hypothetical protein
MFGFRPTALHSPAFLNVSRRACSTNPLITVLSFAMSFHLPSIKEDEDIIHFLTSCPMFIANVHEEPFLNLKEEVIKNTAHGTWHRLNSKYYLYPRILGLILFLLHQLVFSFCPMIMDLLFNSLLACENNKIHEIIIRQISVNYDNKNSFFTNIRDVLYMNC